MLKRIAAAVMGGATVAMAAAFGAMIVLTLVQVVNRYLLGFTLFWTEELVILLLVWSVMLGLPVQLWRHEEIIVDVLPLSGVAERIKVAAAGACSILFCAIVAWTGAEFAARGAPVASPALGLSRLWFFVPIPLAAALSVVALLLRERAENAGGFE